MFITFEGPEGAGKSTQVRRLADALRLDGHKILVTHEPGGTRIGESIRSLLLTPDRDHPLAPRAEVLLFAAARAQLVNKLIAPALAHGTIVLCDRFSDSTIAYQVGGRGLPFDPVRQIVSFAVAGLQPDLTFLLDLDVGEGLSRKQGSKADRMESEDRSFHQRVRESYAELAAREPDRVVVLDARRSADELATTIHALVVSRLEVDRSTAKTSPSLRQDGRVARAPGTREEETRPS